MNTINEQAYYCNQCMDMAYCAKDRVCLEAKQPWPDPNMSHDVQKCDIAQEKYLLQNGQRFLLIKFIK